ncbi:MAG: DUF1801 domain-containing protein [Deltaproteobacteria bacterium]|nr:DUF1801 domain-containing protein [Deltaproteobacteria bacterium]
MATRAKTKAAPKAKPKAKATSKTTARAASSAKKTRAAAGKSARAAKVPAAPSAVTLLSGGNPQIAKGEGDAPVQAYLAAMPGWKSEVGRWLDALIARAVPGVRKAVKWNSPFYGVEGQGWFLGVHSYTSYVKVAFFRGTLLKPPPPGPSKSGEVRYVDLREQERPSDEQMSSWVKQAAAIPGWNP